MARVALLPALELLRPGVGRTPQAAGLLLISEAAPQQPCSALSRELHAVVYCPHSGQLLACRERLHADECCLYRHPRYNKWTWDNRWAGRRERAQCAPHVLHLQHPHIAVGRGSCFQLRAPSGRAGPAESVQDSACRT